MRKIHIIGVGAGNPDHLTLEAIRALGELDVAFLPDKGTEKADLKRLREAICHRYGRPDLRHVAIDVPRRSSTGAYRANVEAWHAAIAARWRDAIDGELGVDECGGFLVWGDPALYDSTIRIIETITAAGFALRWDVIPGISAVQALAAAHKMPLNRIGESVAVVPARRLEEALAAGVDTLVVVLDGERSYRRVVDLDLDIAWGGNVGLEDQRLVAGPLAEVSDEIDSTRDAVRNARGWIMDSYVLRRRRPK